MPDEERSPAEKAQNACCLCCAGWILFPVILFILGWNEKAFVCNQKKILLAQKDAKETDCNGTPGNDVFIAIKCPIDTADAGYRTFTMKDFNVDPDTDKFKDKISFKSLSAEMTQPEMFQCKERSHTEQDDPNCKPSKDKSCSTHLVYDYSMSWSTGGSGGFSGNTLKDKAKRKNACPGIDTTGHVNPAYPVALPSASQSIAPPSNVKLEGAFYITLQTGSTRFTPDSTVPLADFAAQFTHTLANTPGLAIFDNDHVNVVGNYLQTCTSDVLGCVRVSFRKNTDTGASFIGNSGTGGKTDVQDMPASWGCGEDKWYVMYKGLLSKAQMIKKENEWNENSLYALRVVGVLGAWAAVYCCLYPIVAFFDIMEDYLSMVPCIGPCLSIIGTIVEWLVTIVVCCMSCSFGCSAAMFTIAIVWLYMRPMQGILYFMCCIALVGGAYALAHFAPKKEGSQARDLTMELQNPA